jgi:LPXTG-site transpeptidase (sortase) family protein
MNPVEIRASYIAAKAQLGSATEPVILYQATSQELSQATLRSGQKLGLILVFISIGALLAAAWPFVGLEAGYTLATARLALTEKVASLLRVEKPTAPPILAQAKPDLNPLVAPDGTEIVPVNTDFSLVIPSIGINASIIPGVNPASTTGYNDALKKGVAHASTSFYPNENGTVYLFSHSTNYEWFVKDLNAVFYLLKNVKPGDYVVVMYLGDRYTYKIRESKIVGAREVSYLTPQYGTRTLILQTCWPPGTYYKRMLFFADFVEAKHFGNFEQEIQKPTEFSQIMHLATIYSN